MKLELPLKLNSSDSQGAKEGLTKKTYIELNVIECSAAPESAGSVFVFITENQYF